MHLPNVNLKGHHEFTPDVAGLEASNAWRYAYIYIHIPIYGCEGGENAVQNPTTNPNYQGKINQGKTILPRKDPIFTKEKFSKEKNTKKKKQGKEGQGRV